MIYTTLSGRCGNQLFSYAISRQLQEHYKDEITFCDSELEEQRKTDDSFKNELILFNIVQCKFNHRKGKAVFLYGNLIQKIIYGVYLISCRIPYKSRPQFYNRQAKCQPLLNKVGIYDLTHGFSELKYSKYNNKFVRGYYEDERWFLEMKSKLQQELTPKYISTKNEELRRLINNSKSVCVSVRRGDFLNSSNAGLRNICNEQYFRSAIKKMKEMFPGAVFFFFSDDINWVRENYDFGVPTYYEAGNDSVSEKLNLMSSCEHFILSNSTFSWWAQFLAKSPDKIVISPERWFNMKGYKHQLISKDWILIPCK